MKRTLAKSYWDLTQINQIVNYFSKILNSNASENITLWFHHAQNRKIVGAEIISVDSFRILMKLKERISFLEKDNEIYFHHGKENILFKSTIESLEIKDHHHFISIYLPKKLKVLEQRASERFSFFQKKSKEFISNEVVLEKTLENTIQHKNGMRYLLSLFDLSKKGLSFLTKLDPHTNIKEGDIFRIEHLAGHSIPKNLQAKVVRVNKMDKMLNDGSYQIHIGLKLNEELEVIHHALAEVHLVEEEVLGLNFKKTIGGLEKSELHNILTNLKIKNKISAYKFIRNVNALNIKIPTMNLKEKYTLIQKLGTSALAYAMKTCYPSVVSSFVDSIRVDLREELEYDMNNKQPLAIILKKQEEVLLALSA